MATTQASFEKSLEKGEIGEQLIREYLESKGWIVYCPFTKDKAHYFDILATKDKQEVIAMDVKTKARLNKWNAQGIDTKHYKQYLDFVEKTSVPFYLVFVDDKTGDVHSADITALKEGKIIKNGGIIIWELSKMKWLFNIGEETIKRLSDYDQRSYKFNPTKI
jgi:hypothetical protein